MQDLVSRQIADSLDVLQQTRDALADRIVAAAELIVACYRSGGGLLIFGNGGSAADAQHIAAELVGRFLRNRRALRALALTTNSSILTAVANDMDFASIFSRQIEAHGIRGDIALGISTSGNSPNVIEGLKAARSMGLKTIALTGRGGGQCAAWADILLDVPSDRTPHIQEAHLVMYHVLCDLVERQAC